MGWNEIYFRNSDKLSGKTNAALSLQHKLQQNQTAVSTRIAKKSGARQTLIQQNE